MKTHQVAAFAPRTRAVANDLQIPDQPCLGCPGCKGLCLALIEAMTLPDAILAKDRHV